MENRRQRFAISSQCNLLDVMVCTALSERNAPLCRPRQKPIKFFAPSTFSTAQHKLFNLSFLFFHKCKSTGYTPQLSFIMAQGWRDSTLVGKFLTRLMERWDIIDHHRESRKAYSLSWPSFLGSTQKPKSPNLWTEKTNKLDSIGPIKDQQKTLDVLHEPFIIYKYCQKHKWPKVLSTLTHSTT